MCFSRANLRNDSGKAAFTLVELLVVVAIISLLMAILLPALNKARALSKRLVCKGHLRQVVFAWHTYLDDYDGRFYQDKNNADFLYGGWKGIYYTSKPRPLNKYLSLPLLPESEAEAKVYKCPGDNGSDGSPAYSSVGTSYRTNILLIGQDQISSLPGDANNALRDGINSRLKNLTVNDVDNPTQLVLIGDFGWATQWVPKYPRGPAWHGRCCHYNLGFLDGHVDFLKVRKGLYRTDEYTVIPFQELYSLARKIQVEEPCPLCD